MQQLSWLILGGTAFVAALFATRSRPALYLARGALGVLYIAAGAMVHLVYLITGASYSGFADAAQIAFVRDTWQSLVVPNQYLFIGLLVAFEATVGVLILSGGRLSQIGLSAALLMHICLLPFGWIITVWSIAMIAALGLLLRAERHHAAPARDQIHRASWMRLPKLAQRRDLRPGHRPLAHHGIHVRRP